MWLYRGIHKHRRRRFAAVHRSTNSRKQNRSRHEVRLARRADRTPVGANSPGAMAIITNSRGIVLGVYVADCCAVYIVDPKSPGNGLVHPAAKHELGVVSNAINQMIDRFGSTPRE